MFGKSRPSLAPFEAQASEKLALYVYEYLVYSGAQKAAQTFLQEIQWEKNILLTDRPGFLFSWWSVFWDLYCAAPERREVWKHSNEARAFYDYPVGLSRGPGGVGGGGLPQAPLAPVFRNANCPFFPVGPASNGGGTGCHPSPQSQQQQRLSGGVSGDVLMHPMGGGSQLQFTPTGGVQSRQIYGQLRPSGQPQPPPSAEGRISFSNPTINALISPDPPQPPPIFGQLEQVYMQGSCGGAVGSSGTFFRNFPTLPIVSAPSVTLRHQAAPASTTTTTATQPPGTLFRSSPGGRQVAEPAPLSSVKSNFGQGFQHSMTIQQPVGPSCNGGGGPSLNSSSSASSFTGSPGNVSDHHQQQFLAAAAAVTATTSSQQQQHPYGQMYPHSQPPVFNRSTPVKMTRQMSQTAPGSGCISSQWTSVQSDLEEKLPQQQQQQQQQQQRMFVNSFQDSRDNSNSQKFSAPLSVPSPRTLQQQSQSTSRNQQSHSLTPVPAAVDSDSFPLLFDTVEINHSNAAGADGSELFGFYDNIDGLQEGGGGVGGGGYLVLPAATRENSSPGRSERSLLMSATSLSASGEDPNQPAPTLIPVDGREDTVSGLLAGSSHIGNLLSPSPAPVSTTAPPPEVIMTTAGGGSLSLLSVMSADSEMVTVEGAGDIASSRQKACNRASSPQWICSADGGGVYTVPCAAPPPMVSLTLQMVGENQNVKCSTYQRSKNTQSTHHSAGTPQQDESRQFYPSDDIEATLFLQQ
uniref:Single-stranded DNA-binding protein 3 n=1 Tax=Schistocephalus solidus TaxID=70667 RepID=A0A0X3PVX7_SCHSO